MSLYSVNDEVGFPGGSVVEAACQGRIRGLDHWVGKIRSPRKGKTTHSRFLAWEIPQRKETLELQSRWWQKSPT